MNEGTLLKPYQSTALTSKPAVLADFLIMIERFSPLRLMKFKTLSSAAKSLLFSTAISELGNQNLSVL